MNGSSAVGKDKALGLILRATARPPGVVYSPSEDSFLMIDALSNMQLEGMDMLDVGTGSGILGLFCALQGAHVTVTDIDETALLHTLRAARSLGLVVKGVLSDLFSNVQGQFDLVVFNPPYLPSEGFEDKAVDGGKKGRVLIRKFLTTLPAHLEPNGTALLLLSSQNEPASLAKEYPDFDFSIVAKRALFFEELRVLSLRLRVDVAR
jgi:release factor glutamine methyltransferase